MGLLDFLQSANNTAASTVSAPVDGIAWLLRKAGMPVPDAPIGSSAWMEQQGLTRPVQQSAASLAGEAAGLLSPALIAAKAPQVAGGLLRALDNAAKPTMLNSQRGVLSMRDPRKLSRAEYEQMSKLVSDIEKAAEEGGQVFARWSPSAKGDLTPGAKSRDFVSGSTHSGLSAVPITGDMHPVDIAKSINEYSFLRSQDSRSIPRIYAGKKIGVDSDGYASIAPQKLLFELSSDQVSALDKGFVEAFELSDRISTLKNRIARGATTWSDDLAKAENRLRDIFGD